MSNKLKSIKRMTAAQIFLLGKTRLGDNILQITKITYDKHVQTEATNKINTVIAYRAMVIEYDAIIALNINPKYWTVTQIKSVLKPLKTKDDATMPSKKADIYARYIEWIGRISRAVKDVGEEEVQENGAATVYQG